MMLSTPSSKLRKHWHPHTTVNVGTFLIRDFVTKLQRGRRQHPLCNWEVVQRDQHSVPRTQQPANEG
jgi:hypothetical protein